MTEVGKLAQAIRDLHGVEPAHVRPEPIRESAAGENAVDAERAAVVAEARGRR